MGKCGSGEKCVPEELGGSANRTESRERGSWDVVAWSRQFNFEWYKNREDGHALGTATLETFMFFLRQILYKKSHILI